MTDEQYRMAMLEQKVADLGRRVGQLEVAFDALRDELHEALRTLDLR